jgi:hypothetical protein
MFGVPPLGGRAEKLSHDKLGVLTDAFNQMLERMAAAFGRKPSWTKARRFSLRSQERSKVS